MIHRSRPTVVLCLVAALCAATASLADVRWKSGGVGVTRAMPAAELEKSLGELAVRESGSRVIVHLDGPLDPETRAALSADGVRLLSYLGDNAYFANLTSRLDAGEVAAAGSIVQVEAIALPRKLHPDLAAGTIHPWSVLPADAKSDDDGATPRVAVYMLLHRDADVEAKAPALVARHEGRVQSWMRSINGAVVHLPADKIEELAAEDVVMYVEPPLPQFSELNDDNRVRIEAETINAAPYGLDGSGVMVLIYDGGKMFAHGDFGSRLTIGPSDTDGISDHATHVGGTVGGSGDGSGGQFRGMAPAVELISYAFEQEGGLSQGFLYTDPGDIEADYTEAISLGADLSNNSIGSNTAPNGFPCEWEGNYGATGALIDAIARGSLGNPFRIVWANGNERTGGGACGSTYLTTAPPACAKNHITVGALNSNDDSVTSFTSWGPTDDGRIKPDISGPGCQGGGDGGVTSTNSSGNYNVKCGTSMASPTVAGVSALLLQQYRAVRPSEPDFRNSTLKSILANSAADIVETGPDYQSGYGSVRAAAAADTIIEERFVEAQVGFGEVYSFLILVEPEDTELKVTVAWDDPPGTPNVDPVLVNDLDLQVIGPDSTVYLPWTLDPANPANPAVRTLRDDRNNIEQVTVDNPAPGAYRVEVIGFNIADGPTQTFGAAASPSLINCAPAGIVSTNGSTIACNSTLTVQVIDCDLNTSDASVETVDVSVTSTSEPAGETLLLTETAAESAAFQGNISVATSDGSGVIQVADGDTVTVSYVDADDGEGGTNVTVLRDVSVDCTAPLVSQVAVTDVQPRSATATVDTDEPARVTASYGTSCGAPSDTVVSSSLITNHEIRFSNLQDDTTYFFTVALTDGAGNGSNDDNGGVCYSFTTPMIPDFFTEQFSSGLDLEGMQTTFTPNGSNDFYSTCTELIAGGLPVDPAGGTDLNLSDDQPGQFDLTGGATVSLYGIDYGTVHVGPNGYVTFTSGDSDYTETFGDHFDLPRVAALFDDLNPSSAGSVSWLQLSDRVAITWENVPEYSTSNMNTFQIELFFDGRIRLSWVDVDVTDAIVGLSAGNGLDPDFFESDISGGGGCLPTPPAALNGSTNTARDVAVALTLRANDDGQPTPLTYRVTTLPADGRVADPVTGAAILSAPYDLAGGGNVLIYTPEFGYEGADSVTFVADDGGTAPEGGESNPATVDVMIGGPQPVVEALVDDGDPGWSTQGSWAFGVPTGSGSGDGDPAAGHTGSRVYGYNLSGDYADNMLPTYLTSASYDLSGVSNATVEFRRWLGVLSGDRVSFDISTDGGTQWTSLWSELAATISEDAWSLQSFDIAAMVDGETDVSFRWVMGKTNLSGTHPGWNLDDFRILADVGCGGAPGDATDILFDDPQSMRWSAPVDDGGSTPYYDVMRSGDPTDFDSPDCVEVLDGSDRRATVAADPAAGELFYYVVRSRNACGESGIGSDSQGSPRSGAVCTP